MVGEDQICNLSTIHTHTPFKKRGWREGRGGAPTQTKTPTTTLKFKALNPGQQSQSGLGDEEATLQVLGETKHLPSHSTPPVLAPQKAMDYKRYPKKKNPVQKTLPKGSPKQKHLWLQSLVVRRAGFYI